MSKARIKGILTPNLVPLDRNGNIAEDELRRYVEWLVQKGVSGLYPNGSTGEFTRFSPEERREIIRIVASQVNGRVPVLAGAAEATVRDTLAACAAYAEMGCTAAAICAPYYFKLSQDSVGEYFAELARHTELDIVLYNIPQFANEISLDTIERLADFPRIVGIKDSSRDFPRFLNLINRMRPRRPDFSILIGTEEIILPALLMGGDGGTIATSGIVPEVVMKLYALAESGKIEEARKIQFKLLELINVMLFGAGFPEGFRAAASLRGFVMGQSRQPLSPKEKCDLNAVRQTLHCILSEHGFVAEIEGAVGCEPLGQDASPSETEIQAIVAEVVRQMRTNR
ncbi:MAG TPA: dihydrodipicolinate synthase family protein [Candidatus Latescibacteria bacterium]|nr:dihydrodipicolinate synthase family protein [Candidatus Latescibacterota bacterium]HOS65196.1 dihydrodipicolinate synthase family protein [Candidatus Latescibacterota bacterium]HOT37506.1 dihydrodipicolinate synthase family protein [Candidatus Latescibacterota bacterium]HPK74931.1 dihydrodipicolinate synthase family protein [Candidatus Latescibacterota bacterium]HQE62847.1 dihydrodipicolinate synthase family protein [Candidatus Latescibacterota bacterium]